MIEYLSNTVIISLVTAAIGYIAMGSMETWKTNYIEKHKDDGQRSRFTKIPSMFVGVISIIIFALICGWWSM